MEILSPIKNLQNAKIAIKNGADALYLASVSFGARVNASMSKEQIKEIIQLAKSYNVKTFVTFNTIIFEDELEDFFKQIDEIYLFGADAVILQDFSFISIIKENYPDLEIHCSTQMHVHNTNATKIVQGLGAKRIVVPREMNFDLISNIKNNTGIDIEAFVHGALCVCYSGQCYDSTLLDQKSANRGRCSQYCRMPQEVIHKRKNNVVSSGKYPLNLKDLNNLENLDLYKKNGVDSLKIEGRLKGIDYVGLSTKAYSSRLNNDFCDENLEKVYNRTFTTGRINSINGQQLVNLNRPNNNGILIGEIIKTDKNTNKDLGFYNHIITLKLNSGQSVTKGDNLRFVSQYKEYGQLVEQFEKVNSYTYLIYSNEKVDNTFLVYKTKDNDLINKYENMIEDINIIKEIINLNIYLSKDIITYNFTINNKEYDFTSSLTIQQALNRPINDEDITSNFNKTNDTNFKIYVNSIFLEGNSFMPVKHIKLLRDEIIQNYSSLLSSRSSKLNNVYGSINNNNITNNPLNEVKTFYINCKTIEQITYFNNLNVSNDFIIKILINYQLACDLVENDIDLLNSLKEKYPTFLTLPKVIYDNEEDNVLQIISYFNNLCISEIGSIKYKKLVSGEVISNFTFNTTNSININTLNEYNIDKQILSIELNKDKINKLSFDNLVVNIYGRIPVMIMDYCPINLNKTNTCGDCNKCRNNGYFIKDELNRKFPLVYEGNNRIGLYTDQKLSLFNKLNEIPFINNYFLNLTFETDKDLDLLIKSISLSKNLILDSFDGNFYKETL